MKSASSTDPDIFLKQKDVTAAVKIAEKLKKEGKQFSDLISKEGDVQWVDLVLAGTTRTDEINTVARDERRIDSL